MISFLENIKQGFKGKNSWNKYRSEITTETKKNYNVNHLIDTTLGILIDCLFFHSKMVMMILHEIILINITCY